MKQVLALFLLTLPMAHAFGQSDANPNCHQAPPTTPPEPYYPYKLPSGYWDQGGIGACAMTSMVNMNIALLGQDCDKGGKLFEAIQNCLFKLGKVEDWATGVHIYDADFQQCKREAADRLCGKNVNFGPTNSNPGWGGTPGGFVTDPDGSGPGKSPCQKIQDDLNSTSPAKGVAGDIAISVPQTPPNPPKVYAHAVVIKSINCTDRKITFQDPENPDTPVSADFNGDGKLSGASNSSYNDWTIRHTVTETRN